MTLAWRTMQEWRDSGPPNGDKMLVLMANKGRRVAHFDGMSRCWIYEDGESGENPVAWCEIPGVPQELIDRLNHIEQERVRLKDLLREPLELKT